MTKAHLRRRLSVPLTSGLPRSAVSARVSADRSVAPATGGDGWTERSGDRIFAPASAGSARRWHGQLASARNAGRAVGSGVVRAGGEGENIIIGEGRYNGRNQNNTESTLRAIEGFLSLGCDCAWFAITCADADILSHPPPFRLRRAARPVVLILTNVLVATRSFSPPALPWQKGCLVLIRFSWAAYQIFKSAKARRRPIRQRTLRAVWHFERYAE